MLKLIKRFIFGTPQDEIIQLKSPEQIQLLEVQTTILRSSRNHWKNKANLLELKVKTLSRLR